MIREARIRGSSFWTAYENRTHVEAAHACALQAAISQLQETPPSTQDISIFSVETREEGAEDRIFQHEAKVFLGVDVKAFRYDEAETD